MWTLLLVALTMWLFGWHRTLVFFIAIIASILALVLCGFLSVAFSFFVNAEEVRMMTIPTLWTNALANSEWFSKNFWAAFFIPAIFLIDLHRLALHLLINHTNVPIALFACVYAWVAYKIWLAAFLWLRKSFTHANAGDT